jgi:hypothetical protein
MNFEELSNDPWHGLRRTVPDVAYELYSCALWLHELPRRSTKREACIEQLLLLTREVQDCVNRAPSEGTGPTLATLQRGHANGTKR